MKPKTSSYGKFFIAREIFESDIWEKPPYFFKIWLWIIGNANFKEVKKGGQIYQRGEFLTSIPKIIEANEWMVGWRNEKLSKGQVWNVLEFLRKTKRIITRKTTRGQWIKVLNYDYFQTLSNNEEIVADKESNKEDSKRATLSCHYKSNKDKKENLSTASLCSANSPSLQPSSYKVPLYTKVVPTNKGVEQENQNKNFPTNKRVEKKDPKIEVIEFFLEACENIKGFKPRITPGVAGIMIQKFLLEYSIEDITDELSWFLNAEESKKLSCTIKVALSAHVFNRWLAQRETY